LSAHAALPPSSARRWIACPGSVAAERAAPPAPASTFADEGTYAHELFARCLTRRLSADAVTDDPGIAAPLALSLDLTRRILDGRAFLVETRLRPLPGLPDIWGTSDLIGFSTAGPVDTILDLKFGEGILVEADEVQLGIYALLAARLYGASPDGITVWIIQPRCDHADGPARRHHYSLAALDRLEGDIRAAAAAAALPDAPRQAGTWCRFCAAAGECPTRQQTPDAVPAAVSALFRPAPRWIAPGGAAALLAPATSPATGSRRARSGPAIARRVLKISGYRSVDAQDSTGASWTGSGHVILRVGTADIFAGIAPPAGKTAYPMTNIQPEQIDRLITPDSGADLQPITWDATASNGQPAMMVGTLSGGRQLRLQVPIYDALSWAAADGELVAEAGKPDRFRVFARDADGRIVGVGTVLVKPDA
jgi:Protein of unknown function (DUF2800)